MPAAPKATNSKEPGGRQRQGEHALQTRARLLTRWAAQRPRVFICSLWKQNSQGRTLWCWGSCWKAAWSDVRGAAPRALLSATA